MIQNPNEIAARQRMEEAMSRIEANVRARLQMNRRQFICGRAWPEARRRPTRTATRALRLTRRARTRPAQRAATAPST